MRHQTLSLATLGLLLIALLVVPAPGAAFVSDTPMSGLFLNDNETGAVTLAFTPPINQDAEVVSAGVAKSPQDPAPAVVCARAPVEQAPAPLCGPAVLGSTTTHASFQIVGDGGLEVWLSTDAPRLPVRDVIVRLEHVNATGAASTVYEFDYGSGGPSATQVGPREQEGLANLVPWLDGTPRRIAMADIRSDVFNVTAGDTLRLVLDAVMTPVTGEDRAQIRVHYGAAMPSGAVFPVQGAEAWRVQLGTETLALRLRDDNVTFYPVDNETDQRRNFTFGAVNGAALPSLEAPARLTWGPTRLDEATRIVGSGVAEIWLETRAATGANPQLALDVLVEIGDQDFAGVTNTAVNPAQSGGLTKIVVPISMRPTDLVAGMNVTIHVDLYGLNATKFGIVYGSVNHTSGILVPVLGGGLVRPIVAEDPLRFIGPAAPEEEPAEPEEPVEEPAAASDDPETPTDEGSGGEEAGSEGEDDVTLKENEPEGRSPGPGVGLLVAVLLMGAAMMRRGRAGKP